MEQTMYTKQEKPTTDQAWSPYPDEFVKPVETKHESSSYCYCAECSINNKKGTK